MRKLKNYEKELLAEGNTNEFAHLALELHAGICNEAGFTFSDAVNSYRSRTEYNDGIPFVETTVLSISSTAK